MTYNSIFRLALLVTGIFSCITANSLEISLEREGGVYTLPVKINRVITLDFILDSGASEVTIPADVIMTLLRAHTIDKADFLPGKSFSLADGSVVQSERLTIRELELGGVKVLNVPVAVAPMRGSMLLGQSLLQRLDSWAIDNRRHALIVGNYRESDNLSADQPAISVGAHILSPGDGENVGKVRFVNGQISVLAPDQRAFLVIHSTAFGRRVYPQGSIIPGEGGKWSVRGIYGTAGYAYRTYVVMTANPDSIRVLADESSRLHGLAELPSETEIVSSIITVHRQ